MIRAQRAALREAEDHLGRMRARYRRERSPDNRRAYHQAERAAQLEASRLRALRRYIPATTGRRQ